MVFFGKRKFLCLTFFTLHFLRTLPFIAQFLCQRIWSKSSLKAVNMKSILQISLQDIQLQFLSVCQEFLDILDLTSNLFNFAILSFCMINAISCDFVIQWMSNSQRYIFFVLFVEFGTIFAVQGKSDKCFGKIYQKKTCF